MRTLNYPSNILIAMDLYAYHLNQRTPITPSLSKLNLATLTITSGLMNLLLRAI